MEFSEMNRDILIPWNQKNISTPSQIKQCLKQQKIYQRKSVKCEQKTMQNTQNR